MSAQSRKLFKQRQAHLLVGKLLKLHHHLEGAWSRWRGFLQTRALWLYEYEWESKQYFSRDPLRAMSQSWEGSQETGPDYITNRLGGNSSGTCSGILGTHFGTAEDNMANREVHCRCFQSVGPEVLTLQRIVEVGPPWWFTTQGRLPTQRQSVIWLETFTGWKHKSGWEQR